MKKEDTRNRKAIIKQLVRNEGPFSSHEEFMQAFREKEPNIPINQSKVSRDFKDLGIQRNAQGRYELSHDMEQQYQFDDLQNLLTTAKTAYHGADFVPFILSCQPGYAAVIGEALETYFHFAVSKQIKTVYGPAGGICLWVPQDHAAVVKAKLETFSNATSAKE